MSAWACYPALEQNKEKHDRSYNCVWHHLRNFNVRDLIVAAAPDHKNSLATVFAAHQLDSNPESQDVFRSFSVTVLCAEEGSGLMSAGTSGGNVVVWEAYQSNTARGFAEHTAGKCSWSDSQLSVYRMENGGDGSSSSKKLSPKSKIGKGTLFSWDEDEDEEDDDDSEDDENFDDGDENRPSPTSLNLFKSRHDLKVENVYQSNDDADLPLSQSNLNDVPEHQKIDHGASSLEEAPFRPDDIRELFRAKVPGSVTCQLLVSEILILVVGTSLGTICQHQTQSVSVNLLNKLFSQFRHLISRGVGCLVIV